MVRFTNLMILCCCFFQELLSSRMSKSMLGPMLTQLLGSFRQLSFESGQKLKRALRSILQGVLKNGALGRSDYLQLAYGLLSGKLPVIKLTYKGLDELAFGLLHAASNPGANDSPLNVEDATPFFGFIQEVKITLYLDIYDIIAQFSAI